MSKRTFLNNCVGWPRNDVDAEGGLRDMIDCAIQITRSTFRRNVSEGSLAEIENGLGYVQHPKQGLTMTGDYHVTYHRSKLHGKVVYYFCHSAIEFVFA